MKLPKNVRPTPIDSNTSIRIETLAAHHQPGAIDAMRDAIRQDHGRLSTAAWEMRAKHAEPGVLSIDVTGGSRPGTSDVTFVPRSDYLQSASDEERADDAKTTEHIDATDEGRSFLLQMILGEGFGLFRVSHATGSIEATGSGLRKRLAEPGHLTLGREAAA